MKRVTHAATFAIIMLGAVMAAPMHVQAQTFSGSGMPGDPYIITTPAQLDEVRDFLTSHFRLAGDIDLEPYLAPGGAGNAKWGAAGWLPIGVYTAGQRFTGSFHGGGHKITGLWIDRSGGFEGLFSVTDGGAWIDSLGVETAAAGIKGATNTGILVGETFNTSITNCYTAGSITAGNGAGGIVGFNNTNASISNCYSTANVTGTSNVGGVAGINYHTISNCYAAGNITGSSNFVGGIAGFTQLATIQNCVAANESLTLLVAIPSVRRITGMINGICTFNDNYADVNMIVRNSSSDVTIYDGTNYDGTGKPVNTLKSFDFYHTASNWNTSEWDIELNNPAPASLWVICDKEDLPHLSWEGIRCMFCGGDGLSEATAYEICDEATLKSFADFVNAGNGNKTRYTYYKLTADLDLGIYPDWNPVGDYSSFDINTIFQGHFIGDGHVIDNLAITGGGNYKGLFGYLLEADITGLGLENATLAGNSYVGALAGKSENSIISDCYANTNITANGPVVGGLVGLQEVNGNFDNVITNCYATGSVTSNSTMAGGLVGQQNVQLPATTYRNYITYCYATANVSGNNSVGGLVGSCDAYATIANSVAANDAISVDETNPLNANVHRITGVGSGQLLNNYAYDLMSITPSGVAPDIALNGTDGSSTPMTALKVLSFYNTSGNWDTQEWDIDGDPNPAKVWRICDGSFLPIFQWQQWGACPVIPYNAGDIAIINAMIDGNGLAEAKYSDPSYITDPNWSCVLEWSIIGGEWRITGLELGAQPASMNGTVVASSLTELVSLKISGEDITGLDVASGLGNLEKLFCIDTDISSLDVTGCPALTNLQCNANLNLATLTLGAHTGLTQINALDCPNLTGTIDASACPVLGILQIGNTVGPGSKFPGYPPGAPVSHILLNGGYDITFNVSPAGSGVVRVASNVFFGSSPVSLFAVPNTGNTFVDWTSSGFIANVPGGQGNPAQYNQIQFSLSDITTGSPATVTANFTVSYTLAPGIVGPASMVLSEGYAATSTDVFTITGAPAPAMTKISGDAAITWNNTANRLDIAAGLAAGTYTVVLTASNGVAPDATFTFTLTVLQTCSVIYHANGGFGTQTDPNSPYVSGDTVTVLDPGGIMRYHYVFTHWNTAPDGSGDSFDPGDTFTITGDVALYARWNDIVYIDPIIQRSITIAPSIHGTVVADKQYAKTRDTVTLTILPESGYMPDKVTVHNLRDEATTVPSVGDGDVRFFLMPPFEALVRATFMSDVRTTDNDVVEISRTASLRAWTQNGVLHVSVPAAGNLLRVYNLLGVPVYQGIGANETVKIPLPGCGIYIVTDGKQVLKIVN